MRQAVQDPATDYYAVLKVAPEASMRDIRASFKRLVLEAHPDKNPGRRDWSERRIRELIEAFDVLGSEASRSQYDLRRRDRLSAAWSDPRTPSAARSPPKETVEPFFFRKSDPQSRALLILHYLLHRKVRPAIKVLREMEARLGGDFLRTYLDREDYLDCLFLLAEFYCSRKHYVEAAERLQTFYRHEKLSKFPRHYLGEVIRLLKDLYLRKIPRSAGAEAAIRALEAAAGMRLTSAEEALRLRKMAEVHLASGSIEEARRVLTRAERLFPLSKDTQRIRSKIKAFAS